MCISTILQGMVRNGDWPKLHRLIVETNGLTWYLEGINHTDFYAQSRHRTLSKIKP